ncbi:UDP-glucose 4-epimerase [Basidiobolus meristosporus CBS 931.73]|uniref:UDP-glucose 4-epimerase n=1 Tax=Basidiobolus meristosporus CBS 931.73 TaxID=1314790 RepID=A0A1Y1WT96_9FUNG|nr:UDP-glucose 4-epimerase [Basidiobolus meristosporus CBS 931.73]ORX97779.1 UDP-glucose 4-epimerase [Basidiobolus meristosporus CBS 931.73]|eukprot:ORX76615.1 UDP-glucose 4-epimerase [Basidiobolus meristosporus CBS 931.73]
MGADQQKYVLITGGAGYIGSHTVLEMLQRGYKVVVVDNLCNSSSESLRRVEEITGKDIPFHKVDCCDRENFKKVFEKYEFSAVIHFAGYKAVGESAIIPLTYYHNNIMSTLVLLSLMQEFKVTDIVFSSSATVYGDPEVLPLHEGCRTGCTNAYGRTKLYIEEIITDAYKADPTMNAALLRYFNPVGAHRSGRIGEDPQGIPNNLMPYISQVAVGRLPYLKVFGGDYETPDGTGVRDYIHVVDLALGHIAALERLTQNPGCVIYNLGTGNGYSVLDMCKAMSKVVGRELPYKIVERRAGDVGSVVADPALAAKELHWKAERDLNDMCEDLWRWQKTNPHGFKSEAEVKKEQALIDSGVTPVRAEWWQFSG